MFGQLHFLLFILHSIYSWSPYRVLQQLSSKEWQVPEEVMVAVNEVLSQPWGGKEMALYAVLLESVFTATALPYRDEQLTISILKVVLG